MSKFKTQPSRDRGIFLVSGPFLYFYYLGPQFLVLAMLILVEFLQVRNEKADEFLSLLKEWERLCALFSLIGDNSHQKEISLQEMNESVEDDEEEEVDNEEIFEVEKILSICYGIPDGQKKAGLYFKV